MVEKKRKINPRRERFNNEKKAFTKAINEYYKVAPYSAIDTLEWSIRAIKNSTQKHKQELK